jgi:hypothetical protein
MPPALTPALTRIPAPLLFIDIDRPPVPNPRHRAAECRATYNIFGFRENGQRVAALRFV